MLECVRGHNLIGVIGPVYSKLDYAAGQNRLSNVQGQGRLHEKDAQTLYFYHLHNEVLHAPITYLPCDAGFLHINL